MLVVTNGFVVIKANHTSPPLYQQPKLFLALQVLMELMEWLLVLLGMQN